MTTPLITPSQPATVRVSGACGIATAIPQLLGFVPHESLVLACLRGPRGRLGPVIRSDIAPARSNVAVLLQHARRYADEAVIVCFHEGQRPTCIDMLVAGLRDLDIPVVAALSVRGGRVFDSRSPARFRDDEGQQLDGNDDESLALASATLLTGRRVLASREALAASLAGPDPAGVDDSVAAVAAARAALPPAPRHPLAMTESLADAVDAALAAATTEFGSSGTVTLDAAARLIALCEHLGCRDRLLARAIARADSQMVGTLIACVVHAVDADAGPLCTVLAAVAYRSGDGALAHCALDRAELTRPTSPLTALLRDFVTVGMPPEDLASLADVTGPCPSAFAEPARPRRKATPRDVTGRSGEAP